MKTKPNVSAERLAQLRGDNARIAAMVDADRPQVQDEFRQFVKLSTLVPAAQIAQIDEYAKQHQLASRNEVLERALSELLCH